MLIWSSKTFLITLNGKYSGAAAMFLEMAMLLFYLFRFNEWKEKKNCTIIHV